VEETDEHTLGRHVQMAGSRGTGASTVGYYCPLWAFPERWNPVPRAQERDRRTHSLSAGGFWRPG